MAGKKKKTAAKKANGNRIWRLARQLAVWAAAFAIGAMLGYAAAYSQGMKKDDKLVAFRIGNLQRDIDYDLAAAINFLEYKFKEAGYRIAGRAYSGDLYPKEMDAAGVNVFVRGFSLFYDLRMNRNSTNIYYMHRYVSFYAEEMRNYDYYLSSQKNILEAAKKRQNVDLLPGGFVPHERLEPAYEYDVLYIYEYYNNLYDAFIQRYKNPKIYSGMKFAALSGKEREEELRKAKLVVYEMGPVGKDDEIYVPYAAYDIISYGRPLLTNRKMALSLYFGQNVWLFDNVEEMALQTNRALSTADAIREGRAINALQILETFMDMKIPFLEKLSAEQANRAKKGKARLAIGVAAR